MFSTAARLFKETRSRQQNNDKQNVAASTYSMFGPKISTLKRKKKQKSHGTLNIYFLER